MCKKEASFCFTETFNKRKRSSNGRMVCTIYFFLLADRHRSVRTHSICVAVSERLGTILAKHGPLQIVKL